ncbi:MAG: XTP/dITP diphosphatase [candidate division WOR-3 bacterium]|nr:MAG: XTP/dITP diphosphatase [candidate division WOR-3 bacterium]
MKLVVASRNPGKVTELRDLLQGNGWEVVGLADVGFDQEVTEDGYTFEANARKKARAVAKKVRTWTLADDSGLEVDALGGEPGVQSARYAGDNASDTDRMKKLLDRMIAVPDENRTARFRCVICLVDPKGRAHTFSGRCEGRIAHHARGHAGFGYDPVFIPDGNSKTFGELGLDVKRRLSHRARAMQKVVAYLRKQGKS